MNDSASSVDVVLGYLDSQLPQLQEEAFRPRLERLIADMRASFSIGGGTISELFERHKGSLSRPLLLFCLRERCTELLEFTHPLLSDAEYALAAILFGVRDGWLALPRELRPPELSTYVTYRMSEAEHRKQGDKLVFDASAPRPVPLRELFHEWNKTDRDVALETARACGWFECIQTSICLVEGAYPSNFSQEGTQIVFRGGVRATMEAVDKTGFLSRLGQWPPIDANLESELRGKLENGNGCLCG
jgi:hypothetical protein